MWPLVPLFVFSGQAVGSAGLELVRDDRARAPNKKGRCSTATLPKSFAHGRYRRFDGRSIGGNVTHGKHLIARDATRSTCPSPAWATIGTPRTPGRFRPKQTDGCRVAQPRNSGRRASALARRSVVRLHALAAVQRMSFPFTMQTGRHDQPSLRRRANLNSLFLASSPNMASLSRSVAFSAVSRQHHVVSIGEVGKLPGDGD